MRSRMLHVFVQLYSRYRDITPIFRVCNVSCKQTKILTQPYYIDWQQPKAMPICKTKKDCIITNLKAMINRQKQYLLNSKQYVHFRIPLFKSLTYYPVSLQKQFTIELKLKYIKIRSINFIVGQFSLQKAFKLFYQLNVKLISYIVFNEIVDETYFLRFHSSHSSMDTILLSSLSL